MNLLELRCQGFHSSIVGTHIATYYDYPNFQDKKHQTSFKCLYQICCFRLLFFFWVHVGEHSIMADDATMSSNPLVTLV
jgi:hypothetical protein